MVEDTATALAFGEPPGQYHFDQQNMHCHLYSGTALSMDNIVRRLGGGPKFSG